jgi:undecaprenyl-diphosphatase
MIPVGIVGLLYKDTIEQVFMGNVYLVSAMLVITGLLLLFTHLSKKTAGTEISYWQALIIGIAQSIAVIPGISRSGATIATAILIGVDKSKAAKFSFLMVLPPIIGMNLLALKDYLETDSDSTVEGLSLLIGFIAAFLTGLFACKIMIELVKKGKLLYFALYCFVIGLLGIILS